MHTPRLWLVIHGLVSHIQITFICGRSIYDGWIIAFEVLDAFEKPYEKVECHFLSYILSQMGLVLDTFSGLKNVFSSPPQRLCLLMVLQVLNFLWSMA